MEQQTHTVQNDQEVVVAGVRLTGYWQMAKWPVAVATLANAALLAAGQPWAYLWAANVALFLSLSFWLHTKKLLNIGSASAMGIISGLALGFFVAIFRLVIEREAYLFFNLITEPLVTAAGGLLFCTLYFSLTQRKNGKIAPKGETRKEVK